jgi:hypothetical protein
MQKRTAATAVALAAAAIVLVSATAKPKLQLQAGGRTIGGPVAVRNLAPGANIVAFFFQGFAEGGLDVCATVVNTGRGVVTFQVFGDAGGGAQLLAPGGTHIYLLLAEHGQRRRRLHGRRARLLLRVARRRSLDRHLSPPGPDRSDPRVSVPAPAGPVAQSLARMRRAPASRRDG